MNRIDRIPKSNTWLAPEVEEWYLQYAGEQSVYRSDFLDRLEARLVNQNSQIVMEYCSGVNGLVYQGLILPGNQHCYFVETNSRILDRLIEKAGRRTGIPWTGIMDTGALDEIGDGTVDMVYSLDYLHDNDSIEVLFSRLLRKTRDKGELWFYDLRRDAEPNMLKEILVDYKNRKDDCGRWYLENFVSSWRAAYTVDEVDRILKHMECVDMYQIEKINAMAMAIRIVKGDR